MAERNKGERESENEIKMVGKTECVREREREKTAKERKK